jgi:two-component system sensor histidine kinase UhpB
VSVQIAPELPSFPAEIELVVYRVAQEALTNVARHSASSRADLMLVLDEDRLVLAVRDYGLGLPAAHIAGTGLRGMRERAALIGARLDVANHPTGTGCEVRLEVPLEENH